MRLAHSYGIIQTEGPLAFGLESADTELRRRYRSGDQLVAYVRQKDICTRHFEIT